MTTFVDNVTVINAAWLNSVDVAVRTALGDGVNTPTTQTQVKTNLGINNVDNTSDVNKPISTATQTALNLKQDTLPSQTGNNGKYLGTNGSALSWQTVDALPTQTGNNGKYLTTNGTAASWSSLSTGSSGFFEHPNTISANQIITTGSNAISAGPITINSGVVVTVPDGSTWSIV